MTVYSLLDLAFVGPSETPSDAFTRSVLLAQRAERLGFERIWYAEHHNMPTIASSAPAVLISHVAARTSKIKLGAGGVMLPNHAPLVVAEQFGTLEALYPGRIGLGLGRAPGTDPRTLRALRRDPNAAESFPDDVAELRGYLADATVTPGVNANPGRGSKVPLYILGSSLFGAQLAAALGLPYAFASHFAPEMLEQAINVYRARFRPSEQCAEPYVIAAANFIVADEEEAAKVQHAEVLRRRVRMFAKGAEEISDADLDAYIASGKADQIVGMLKYTAVGVGEDAKRFLDGFEATTGADEVMLVNLSPGTAQAERGLDLLARAIVRPAR